MRNKLLALTLSAVMVLGLTACGSAEEEKPEEVNIPVDTMIKDIEKELEFGAMMELDSESLMNFYELDEALFEEYSANIPMMNVQTNEYSVFKLNDEADVEKVKEALTTRAETVQKTFETYLEDQYENAKNFYLDSNGKYVIFVIHENVDNVKPIFENYFK